MKQSLRQSIIAARQKLAAPERTEFSRVISRNISQLDVYYRAQVVLLYMHFGAEFEAGTLVQQALLDGKQVLLPKVNRNTKQLDIYRVNDMQQDLAAGTWGISEPLAERCEKIESLSAIEFILLPGVAFSRDGSRLGYGGGFYDKLLERVSLCGDVTPPALVGAAFSLQVIEDIPQEPTDRKVAWLLTEAEVIACGTESK